MLCTASLLLSCSPAPARGRLERASRPSRERMGSKPKAGRLPEPRSCRTASWKFACLTNGSCSGAWEGHRKSHNLKRLLRKNHEKVTFYIIYPSGPDTYHATNMYILLSLQHTQIFCITWNAVLYNMECCFLDLSKH